MTRQAFTVILGAQWGDEGKGKLVDVLSANFDIVARATGGANAGHTVYVKQGEEIKKFVFHLLPSGLLYPHVQCVIGNGVVLHVPSLFEEIEAMKTQGYEVESRVKISDRIALLFDYHKLIDGAQEDSKGTQKVGTTRRGIGPAYADKINRRGLRLCDLAHWESFVEKYKANVEWHQKNYGFEYDAEAELAVLQGVRSRLLAMMVDGALVLDQALAAGKKVLVEGANATLLDIDHGTFPFVTSSNPSIGGIFTGTGLSPRDLGDNIGIVKAYMTRVGSGPFPTELVDALGDSIREAGGEYGSTTGRPRRCGWFDVPMTKYSVRLNGFTALNLTKLDVLDALDEVKIAVAYKLDGRNLDSIPASLEDLARVEVEYETLPGWKSSLKEVTSWDALPQNAKNYVLRLEALLGCPLKYVGVGQRRDQLLLR
ncbi:adenylosuccinate synthase [Candidatus Peregrinibacteria bacterium]|nr:MAG: adenylosuccinate synthase [Candidatus Peregrinibacteria bacterium]